MRISAYRVKPIVVSIMFEGASRLLFLFTITTFALWLVVVYQDKFGRSTAFFYSNSEGT